MLQIRVINFYDVEGDLTHVNMCVADKGDQLLQGRGPNSRQAVLQIREINVYKEGDLTHFNMCRLQIREINFYDEEGDLTRFNMCVADKGDQLLR